MKEQIEKQAIEEMATVILEKSDLSVVDIAENVARILFEEGYRKQIVGEWETILHNPRGEMLNVYSHICKVEGCGYFYKDIRPYGHKFCPNCGAKMKGCSE